MKLKSEILTGLGIVAVAVILLLSLLVTGCKDETFWEVRHEPMTALEREAVSAQVAKLMAATPHQLAGHDQDWDDAIRAATESAKQSICQPTLWEHNGYGRWTGKWKPVPGAVP